MAAGVPCALNPRYYIFKITPETVQPKKPGAPSFVVDYNIRLKLSASSAKKLGREFAADPLTPYAVQSTDHKDRWDLRTAVPHGQSHESVFARCIAFSLLKYNGRKIRRDLYHLYNADHLCSERVWDCRLENLQILSLPEHREKSKADLLRRSRKRPASAMKSRA